MSDRGPYRKGAGFKTLGLGRGACGAARPPIERGFDAAPKEPAAMVAIVAILVFIVAIGALNYFEFGRID